MTTVAGITLGTRISADGSSLGLQVVVDDAEVRSKAPGFDGLEDAFALVPQRRDGVTEWASVPLRYRLTYSAGHGRTKTLDVHEVELAAPDRQALASNGIAVGLRTNLGTLWAQELGDNKRVELPTSAGPTPPPGLVVGASAITDEQGFPAVRVQVMVEDRELSPRLRAFDGLERVYTLVPRYQGTTLVWEEQPLRYVSTVTTPLRSLDVHERVARAIDVRAVRDNGIAVVVRTNAGEVWAQPAERNFPVSGIESY